MGQERTAGAHGFSGMRIRRIAAFWAEPIKCVGAPVEASNSPALSSGYLLL
jgi:hypothetical protein